MPRNYTGLEDWKWIKTVLNFRDPTAKGIKQKDNQLHHSMLLVSTYHFKIREEKKSDILPEMKIPDQVL